MSNYLSKLPCAYLPAVYLLMAIAITMAPFHAQATIYKWVDEEGTVHYSETPPPEGKVEKISNLLKPSIDPEEAKKKLDEQINGFSERRDKKLKSAEKKQANEKQAEANEAICKQLRSNLEALNNHARVKTKGPDGESIFLDDTQKLEKIKETQKRIAEECSG